MAEDKKEEASSPPPVPECGLPIDLTVDSSWLETTVFGNFRVWHIMFSGIAIATALTVVLCCLFRCRIPRTKQEIEADFLRKKITETFYSHLEKIKLDELQGQYDSNNLLQVFKKVELFEEDRLQKNEGFVKRKLNWRQKLVRFFSGGKDSSDEFGDRSIDESRDQTGAGYKKMTKEEMENVEKEVEGAKTDTLALNMINDQIAIFSFLGETKKDRKKRIKEQKKADKALRKELKLKEKLEKKLAKEAKDQTYGKTSSARAKSTQKLMQLRGDTLESDHLSSETSKTLQDRRNGKENGDMIIIDIQDSDEMAIANQPVIYETIQSDEIDDRGYREISLPIPEKEDFIVPTKKSFASKFSFRETVNKLINFRVSKPKKEEPPPTPKKEELVINIEMVKKEEDSPPPQRQVSIPHIEYSPPELDEEQPMVVKTKRKIKLNKKDSVLEKDDSLDKNRLHIPNISKSTKEVNSERIEKVKPPKKSREDSKDKEERKKRKDKKAKESEYQKEKNVLILELDKKTKDMDKHELMAERESKSRSKEREKLSKSDKHSKEDSKRTLLKRQPGADDGSVKSDDTTRELKDTKKHDKQEKDKQKIEKAKKKAEKYAETETVKDKKHKDPKAEVSHVIKPKKHKEDKQPDKDKQSDTIKKHKKSKEKHLEFDYEKTVKFDKRLTDDHQEPTEGHKLDTFPEVVEKMKERHEKMKRAQLAIGNGVQPETHHQQDPLPKPHSKEHSQDKLKEKSISPTKDIGMKRGHDKKTKEGSPHHKKVSSEIETRERNFDQYVTTFQEELKRRVSERSVRIKQLKRSKTMNEEEETSYDIVSPQEDGDLRRSRYREKRHSEVMLQETLIASRAAFAGLSPQAMAAAATSRSASQIRVIKHQGTSSSEIEIPVEHVYTQVEVHHPPDSVTLPVALLRHPTTVGPHIISSFVSLPPSPSPSRSSTISVVTDNLVKKLVEGSPKTGENRELTYERSRDVIFSVQQPTTVQQVESPKLSIAKVAEGTLSPDDGTSGGHHSEASSSGVRQRTKKDKPTKEHKEHKEHRGHHH